MPPRRDQSFQGRARWRDAILGDPRGDQVARLADSWEEWRAADPMAELGRKLDELCQLVSQSARPAAASPRDGSSSRFTDSWSGDFQLPPPPTEKPLPKWEQMKAQLLGDSTVGEQSWDLPPPAETPDQATPAQTPDQAPDQATLAAPDQATPEKGAPRAAAAPPAPVVEIRTRIVKKIVRVRPTRFEVGPATEIVIPTRRAEEQTTPEQSRGERQQTPPPPAEPQQD